ncbi:pyocin knob domain-containing protein [Serratia sp. 14-2641]|uniref:pyocin knob domain-containing protein n=1 Tax=Serratia sp. 14-2641 TaxID=1841657 RepID=UPI0008100A5E|nr:pyocin knob domain-containing protein [Serratia sp. 14-2641]OCJ43461.1 hypothetical protein A6U95_20485 [Serratia sp. 14-2641]
MEEVTYSNLPAAAEIKGDEVLAVSQAANGKLDSVKLTLDQIKTFSLKLSAQSGNQLIQKTDGLYVPEPMFTLLTPTTNLNSVTKGGLYIAPGGETSQGSYNMNYPFGVSPGSAVFLLVSADANGTVTQSIYASFNASEPGPWVRVKSSSWSAWSRVLDTVTFNTKGVQQVNFSQNNLKVHKTTNGASCTWRYVAPDGTTSTPNPKTTPTTNEGVALTLKNPYSKPTQGVFTGVVLAVDSDGRAFTNVDRQNPGTDEAPGDLNWREMVSVHINSRATIPNATTETVVETLNAILSVMRKANMIGGA